MALDKIKRRSWKYWTEPSVADVDGVPTAYRRGGSGETVVYLHGGGATRQWGPIHRALSGKFDVIAPEHPGYGDTPRHEDQDSWADYILHYEAFCRNLGLGEVHLVGTSLGAWLAANLAIFFPDRFASLTLVTPLGLRIENEPFIDVFRFTPEKGAAALFNGRAARHLPDLAQEGELEDGLQSFEEEGTAALLFWNPRYDLKLDRRLKRVTIPSLVIGVDDDRIAGNLQAPRYAELLPNATYQKISGPEGEPSSHALPIEQPQDVADAIAAFVDRVRATAPNA